MKCITTFCLLLLGLSSNVSAALVVNPPTTITHLLPVNIIQVAEDDGSNAAPLFGTAAEQASIFSLVDQIWAQAGVDVQFSFATQTLNHSASLNGMNSLSDVVAAGDAASLTVSTALDLFMVRANSGQIPPLSDFSSAGLAFLNGDGMTLWAGPSLPGFEGGREVIASVLAHEIGHNLGLPHPVTSTTDMNGMSYNNNLMVGAGSDNPLGLEDNGQLLLQSQIDTALMHPSLVAVPEPSSAIFILFGLSCLLKVRTRKR